MTNPSQTFIHSYVPPERASYSNKMLFKSNVHAQAADLVLGHGAYGRQLIEVSLPR